MQGYLAAIKKQFHYYKQLADKCFSRLSNDDIHWQFNNQSNSIAITVKHIAGNMKSRWTNFLTEDGEKSWRNRDNEFKDPYVSKAAMIEDWESGWDCLFGALESIADEDLSKLVYIRNIGHTVSEAINRQLAHYPYHIGQIVYITRMIKGEEWESLSIPKGDSEVYNKELFSKQKSRGHYTDNFLDQESDHSS